MTDRFKRDDDPRIRSGRRLAVDIEEPRDRTVCFTLSESERVAVDALAARLSRTRSAVLTRIVNAFVADCEEGGGPVRVVELFNDMNAKPRNVILPPNRK